MNVEEERKISLNSYKLDKSVLKQICELLEEEGKKIENENKESRLHTNFRIESKKRDITAHTTESLLNTIPKSFTDIRLSLYVSNDKEQEIWIRLALSGIGDSSITVKGVDSTWVNGIAVKIEDIFEENKTKNWIFNSYIYRIPFTLAITILIGSAIAFLDTTYLHNEWTNERFYKHVVEFSIAAAFPSYLGVGWLFPKIEYEEILMQTRIRKRIFAGLGIILAGLIVAGLSKLF